MQSSRLYILFMSIALVFFTGGIVAYNNYIQSSTDTPQTSQQYIESDVDEEQLRREYSDFLDRVNQINPKDEVSDIVPMYKVDLIQNENVPRENVGKAHPLSCTNDDVLRLSKFDSLTATYTVFVSDICSLKGAKDSEGEVWPYFNSLSGIQPLWSKDGRYVALVSDDNGSDLMMEDMRTSQRLFFIDTHNIQDGIQTMNLPGVVEYGPVLEVDGRTLRTSKDGHTQMIGIGRWREPYETYVYVFDVTDWSLKQIVDINPDTEFLIYRGWEGESSVLTYSISRDTYRRCEQTLVDLNMVNSLSKDPCRELNFSNYREAQKRIFTF